MARAKEKIVELQGRKFKISPFDAFTGSYIAFTVFQKALPAGIDAQFTRGINGGLAESRTMMSKEEFFALQKDCLSVVAEILPAGERPIINANGSWGVGDMADNTTLVILLTIHSLLFNVTDFFSGGGLKELKDSLLSSLPSNIPT